MGGCLRKMGLPFGVVEIHQNQAVLAAAQSRDYTGPQIFRQPMNGYFTPVIFTL